MKRSSQTILEAIALSHFLKKSQWFKRKEILKYQNQNLRHLVKHAYEKVPYYHRRWREMNIGPEDIKSISDLKKLPIITKEEVKENLDSFKSVDFALRNPKSCRTSGTTGTPMQYWVDRYLDYALRICTFRGWSWAGYGIGDKMAIIGGTSLVPRGSGGYSRFDSINNIEKKLNQVFHFDPFHMSRVIKFDTKGVNSESAEAFLKKLEKFQPKYIRGYPSSISYLSEHINHGHPSLTKLKAVFATCETLTKECRAKIEESYGVDVFDEYGARDGGVKAMECTHHNGMHLSFETSITEFLRDGEDVSPGEPGSIITTSLGNFSFPFIRYEVGDIGTHSDQQCSCGREMPIMKEVKGRKADIIHFSDGTSWVGLPAISRPLSFYDIKQFQIVVEGGDNITFLVIPGVEFTQNREKELLEVLKRKAGKGSTIEIERVRNIPSSKSGKQMAIVNRN